MVVAKQHVLRGFGPFANLMELHENNYRYIRLLIPHLRQMGVGESYESHVEGCLSMYLSVEEQCRFTTTINLSYLFSDSNRQLKEPDLTIRIYHDARAAEAMSGLIHGRRHEQRQTRSLAGSWTLNRFLYKWLRYSFYRGHRFTS